MSLTCFAVTPRPCKNPAPSRASYSRSISEQTTASGFTWARASRRPVENGGKAARPARLHWTAAAISLNRLIDAMFTNCRIECGLNMAVESRRGCFFVSQIVIDLASI